MRFPTDHDVLEHRREILDPLWAELETALAYGFRQDDFPVPADEADRARLLRALGALGWVRDPVISLSEEHWPWSELERVLVATAGAWDRVIRPEDGRRWEALIHDYVDVGWVEDPPPGEPDPD
jgi:hypothetical protein